MIRYVKCVIARILIHPKVLYKNYKNNVSEDLPYSVQRPLID